MSGFSLTKLQKKQASKSKHEFTAEDIAAFEEENQDQLFTSQVVADHQQEDILEEFDEEKLKVIGEELPKEQAKKAGWGTWAGSGIKEREESKKEKEKKAQEKKMVIENLRKRRKDGKMDNVVFNEAHQAKVRKFRMEKLPHPFQNADQYDYLEAVPLGPEWNTLGDHRKVCQPRVKTRVGHLVQPIKMNSKPKDK